jgi:hypothetical protein
MYSLEALTNTCGNIVTDHFVDFRSRKKFFSQVRRLVKTNRRIALDSLEKLVEDLSDRKEVPIGINYKFIIKDIFQLKSTFFSIRRP